MRIDKLRALVSLLLLLDLLATASAQGNTVQLLTSTLCGIVGGVRAVVGDLALALFLLGGILYASAHFLPSAGNLKPQAQSWSMAMLIGGVIGVILVIVAPLIVSIVIQFQNGALISAPNCP